MKKILGKFSIFDIIIVLGIIAIVCLAFIKTYDSNEKIEKVTFDGFETNKVFQKYGEFYSQGKLITAKISGTDKAGKLKEYEGEVIACNENEIVLLSNNTKIIGSNFANSKYADLYLKSISLTAETNPNNITVIVAKPKEINSLNELIIKSTDKKYFIKTDIAFNSGHDSSKVQKMTNELYSKLKLPTIDSDKYGKPILLLRNTGPEELEIANNIFKSFNGETGYIYINIYNASSEDIGKIKQQYNVESVSEIKN